MVNKIFFREIVGGKIVQYFGDEFEEGYMIEKDGKRYRLIIDYGELSLMKYVTKEGFRNER